MSEFSRRRFLVAATAAGVAGLSGCVGFESGVGSVDSDGGERAAGDQPDEPVGASDTSDAAAGAPATTQPAGDPTDHVPTATEALPLPMSPAELRAEAQSGGPPKDGIPSIDEPNFLGAGDVGFLEPGDPVFGVARGDTVKAYPQKVLVQHEICNDTVDGTSVAVTYCPLTGTVQGFERGDTTFGVSGRLINNNLVMYDRATGAWWPQVLATAVPGPWNADPPTASLREFRLVWTTWKEWRDAHPDAQVLSTDTGYARNYGRDPYGQYNAKTGYYANANTLFPRLNPDDSHHAKKVFVGARTPDGAAAFGKSEVQSAGVVEGQIGDVPVFGVADPRFTTAYVYLNPDEQSVEYDDGRVHADGESYAPDDLPMERVHSFDAMWFAWHGYYPDTTVYA